MCYKRIVLKTKSIVMRTTNNVFRKVLIILHILSGDLLSLNKNVIFWRFFITFNILNVFVRWKNGKFQSPKSSTGTSISVTSLIPRCRALSLLSKSIFKIMGNLKENFWSQKTQVVLFWNLNSPDSAGRCLPWVPDAFHVPFPFAL